MKIFKKAALLTLVLTALISGAAGDSSAAEATKSMSGIKAVLKTTPGKSMIDLYLYDHSKTLTPLTKAKVKAVVTLPDGTTVEKELIGMVMDGSFSYMNSLDLSQKGRYKFIIRVEAGKRPVTFEFVIDEM